MRTVSRVKLTEGSSSELLTTPVSDGRIFITSDTRELYLDSISERIQLSFGGSSPYSSYTSSIVTDNGLIFKNGVGSTTLTAQVKDGDKDISNNNNTLWYKDGRVQVLSKSITVHASDIVDKAVYKFISYDDDSVQTGECEVTVTNINDGSDGEDGVSPLLLYISSEKGDIFNRGQIDTVLTATVVRGESNVTDEFDENQFIWTRVSENEEDDILWNKKNAGGKKSIRITSQDVFRRATFFCDLIDIVTRRSLIK